MSLFVVIFVWFTQSKDTDGNGADGRRGTV